MENTGVKNTTLSWVIGMSLLAASAFGYYQFKDNEIVEKSEMRMKAKADSLTFMKNQLINDIETLEATLEVEKREREQSDLALSELEASLAKKKKANIYSYRAKKKEIDELQEQKDLEIAGLNTEIAELNELKGQMEKELERIPILENEKALLEDEVLAWEQKYASLEKDFNELNKRYAKLIYDAPGDRFNVEVLAKNGVITSKANKASKIKISFLMPEFMQEVSTSNEQLYLSIFDEMIEPVKGFEDEITIEAMGNIIPIPVHAKKTVDYSKNPQVVNFEFDLQEKLAPGKYDARVYANNDYLGTAGFRLRGGFLGK